jgi:hypothetical protein
MACEFSLPNTKKAAPERAALETGLKRTSGSVGDRADASDAGDRDRYTLREVRRVRFAGHGVDSFHVFVRANQIRQRNRRDAVLEEVLVGRGRKLASIVQHGLVLRRLTNLLERRNRHRSQEADDDNDDHDFDEREALVGVYSVHGYA